MKKIIVLFLMVLISNACINDVDFDQDTTIDIITPYTISFAYMMAEKSDFIVMPNQVVGMSESIQPNIKADLMDKIYSDVTFDLLIENSFLNEFELTFQFFDADNNSLDFYNFIIPAHASATGTTTFEGQFIVPSNDFKMTKKILVSILPLTSGFPDGNRYELDLNSSLSFEVKY